MPASITARMRRTTGPLAAAYAGGDATAIAGAMVTGVWSACGYVVWLGGARLQFYSVGFTYDKYFSMRVRLELSKPVRSTLLPVCSRASISLARALPSSTPHWSNELMPQM